MNDDVLNKVLEIGAAMEDSDRARAEQLSKDIPVAVRGVLAAVVLGATNRAVNQSQVAKVGRFARKNFSSDGRSHKDMLATQLGWAVKFGGLIAEFLLDEAADGESVTDLKNDVQKRDKIIEDGRAEKADLEATLKSQRAYAVAMHNRALPDFQENLRTRKENVVEVPSERWGKLKIVEDECATEPSEHPSAGTESQHD